MFGYGHFQAYNLFQVTKYCTSSVLRKVFSCAKLFSKVSRATGCQKVEEIWKNAKMLIFRPFAQCSRSLQSARIWSKSSILVLFGPLVGLWYMQSCFPMFVGVFQAIRGVKNDLNQKMSFVGVHPLMKSGQKGASQGEPLGINFFGLSMHFPHQLGKRDGKINWFDRSDLFGAFWATLIKKVWSSVENAHNSENKRGG